MGTRSFVGHAILDPNHVVVGVRGRYVHWDGYPEGVGGAVISIIRRDGAAKALQVLSVEHAGWSNLDPDYGDRVKEDDGRFVAVPGYGEAYTSDDIGEFAGQEHYRQIDPEMWVDTTETPFRDFGTEWGYGIDVAGGSLAVVKVKWNYPEANEVLILGTVPLDDDAHDAIYELAQAYYKSQEDAE